MLAGILATANLGVFAMSQLGTFRDVTPDSWRWLMLAGATPFVLGLLALWVVPESPKWMLTRAASQSTTQQAPIRELFRPPLLRLTIIGICLGTIPLLGAWGASKWMIPWADKVGGLADPGYKASTQAYWAAGAVLGSFFGGHIASLLGRRLTYFLISLGAVTVTGGIFVFLKPLDPLFLRAVFVQGFVSTLFFGWLPLCLPELFPTRVRATGTGVSYNFGRFASAGSRCGRVDAAIGGDYGKVGALCSLVYGRNDCHLWAPDTTARGD